ncbi:CAP domain-containing protein [Candidatus Parcubacteria bacterium]|nr:CAP domain-containing protein [Candidatus Parcubacteria bacterium]
MLKFKNVLLGSLFLIVGALPLHAFGFSTQVVLDLINEERANVGVAPLVENPLLDQSAQNKASDMSTRNYFSHNTPEGELPWVFFDQVGYKYTSAAENLAVNSIIDEETIVEQWMNSPEHRKTLLDPKYTETGIGASIGVFNGKQAVYAVEHFGVPVTPYVRTQTELVQTQIVTSVAMGQGTALQTALQIDKDAQIKQILTALIHVYSQLISEILSHKKLA